MEGKTHDVDDRRNPDADVAVSLGAGENQVQFYTGSARKVKRFSVALNNLTGHPPSLFRFPGGRWAVQEESLSAAAGHAVCRLLACGVRCDRITGPMVLAELVAPGSDPGA
jgi:hypothetical protein